MFREMRRKKQQLSQEECVSLLKNEKRGVLSVLGDDDYPYGMPLDHWYCEEDGHLYFHGSKVGHKVDAMKRHDKVSFCVYDEGFRREGEWALNIKSVIVFGRVQFVTDQTRAMEAIRQLGYKHTDDTEYIERELAQSYKNVLCYELIPEYITGKITNEA